MTPYKDMSEAPRDCQRRFDDYLLEGGPRTIADFHIQVDRTGIAAMNRLRPVVPGLAATSTAA